MAVADIYLVSERITRVSWRDIDRLERTIGSLPRGYREFMSRCGCGGELCSEIRVWHPEVILAEVERAREDHTQDRCIEYSYPGRLTLEDFRGLWPFGTTVDGDRLVYLPHQPGVLFNIHHNADRISRHPLAFDTAWRLGTSRSHPFPYFDAEGKQRQGRSFDLRTRIGTTKLAQFAVEYWGGEVHRVRMPRSSYGDTVMVFVKRIGGLIQFTYEPENNLDEVLGGASFDRGFTQEVKAFEQKLSSKVAAQAESDAAPDPAA